MTPHQTTHQHYQNLGWKPHTHTVCPRRLTTGNCLKKRSGHNTPCLCDNLTYPLWDHLSCWTTTTGQHAIISHTYGASGTTIATHLNWITTNGLHLTLRPYSPYLPGYTTAIELSTTPLPHNPAHHAGHAHHQHATP